MRDCDVLIVGGGPAGSTCARLLRRAGWNVVVIDRARFPRDKVCGGWLTPDVFELLELDPASYRSAGLTLQEITAFRTGVLRGPIIDTEYPRVASYAVRRCEFDDFLLRRAEVPVLEQTALTSLARDGDAWVVNGEIRTPLVIGAGGHFCPVAQRLRDRTATPPPVVAKEAEFRLDGRASTVVSGVPELFFCRDLNGYGWCVRKGDYLNIGIGRRSRLDFNAHVDDFVAFLERTGKAPDASRVPWHGHAYLAAGVGARAVVADGLMLVGDAAGLAYPESGEGIKPAIESARVAAATIVAAKGGTHLDDLLPYQASLAGLHPPPAGAPPFLQPLQRTIGRALLRSRSFTRRVVLDRWFLRTSLTAAPRC